MRSFKIAVTSFLQRAIESRFGVSLPLGRLKIFPGVDLSLEPPCRISGGVFLAFPTEIGAFSYFDKQESDPRMLTRGARIGRYCSIGIDVQLGLVQHPTQWCSTSPAVYDCRSSKWAKWFGAKIQALAGDFMERHDVAELGNDVWVGSGAKIMHGVKIGNGAIVGAAAVVTKDVPPYAIVGGVPARIIRYRFDEDTIRRLEAVKWWEYDLSSFGPIDFSDIHKALDAMEAAVRECRAKPYVTRKIDAKDLMPYSGRCLFHISCKDGWLCLKCFGVWLVHFRIGKQSRVRPAT